MMALVKKAYCRRSELAAPMPAHRVAGPARLVTKIQDTMVKIPSRGNVTTEQQKIKP